MRGAETNLKCEGVVFIGFFCFCFFLFKKNPAQNWQSQMFGNMLMMEQNFFISSGFLAVSHFHFHLGYPKKNKTNKSETENERRGKILKDKPESLRYCCHLAFFCLVNCAVQLKDNSVDWPEQMTPTSSPWPQLLVPKGLWVHWKMDISSPLHCTSSSQMSPCPSPKKADALAARAAPHCSSLHATLALARPQLSSHTVPHLLS